MFIFIIFIYLISLIFIFLIVFLNVSVTVDIPYWLRVCSTVVRCLYNLQRDPPITPVWGLL